MAIFDILYSIFIGPLKLVFEFIYVIANRFIGHPGLSIIVLSLIMNFLVLPLYKRSDAMQEEARDTEEKLKKGVDHIKKTFSGDERMMIMQTYYRQNNYKPTDALNGSVSLLLQVPFFMAAYDFLSNLELIQGVSLGPIADLGAQDAMIAIGGMHINFLPILMTLVNIISSAIYLKGFPLKTKIQLYGMALFFLVFLYTSPAGLVFYWTLNNVFSLVKTIFYKLKNPKKVLSILASVIGVAVLVLGIGFYHPLSFKRKLFVIAMGILLQAPNILPVLKKYIVIKKNKRSDENNNKKLFVLCCLFLTVLIGGLIPSTVIASSAQEFVDITYFYNPIWYIVNAMCLASGLFIVWMGIFYWIASPKGKVIFDKVALVLCGVTLVNYMFFGTELGMINKNLVYEDGLSFSSYEMLLNILVSVIVILVLWFVVSKWKMKLSGVILTALIAISGMSALNVGTIHEEIEIVKEQMLDDNSGTPQFNLSKTGQNVIVLMLDRAMGAYLPYLMNENPELKEQFAGFTYYQNTVSFGGATNFASPALFGGYEYTPIEINKREDEKLVDKHNEALKVMPVLFSQNGYDVTVCDVPYANYQWIPDMSIYDEWPEIDTYITEGLFVEEEIKQIATSNNLRNFFCFSLMKVMPLFAQESIYEYGNYNQAADTSQQNGVGAEQTVFDAYTAEGVSSEFLGAYTVLENMIDMTTIVDEPTNNFLLMNNNTPHEPNMLQLPGYEVSNKVDNSDFYKENEALYTINGVTFELETVSQISHYHVNMVTMMKLGEWFDYLRKNDVYDNTRIILVADHGSGWGSIESLVYDESMGISGDFCYYYPLLMVKDFNSNEFTVSNEFMTNADTPTLAFQDIIENPVNPFTGKEITNDAKSAEKLYVMASSDWELSLHGEYQFNASKWFTVHDNLLDANNWELLDEVTTIPEECK